MPDIKPTSGDIIEVQVKARNSSPQTLLALVVEPAEQRVSGNTVDSPKHALYNIRLEGTPEFTGVVDINEYDYNHNANRWVRKPPPAPALNRNEIKYPNELPRAAG